ncbi:MAG: serine protease [Bacteroidota bacterium]
MNNYQENSADTQSHIIISNTGNNGDEAIFDESSSINYQNNENFDPTIALENIEGIDPSGQFFDDDESTIFEGNGASINGANDAFDVETLVDAAMGSYSTDELGLTANLNESGQVIEIVHGKDDRIKIGNTRRFPWSAIVQLSIQSKRGPRYVGTGWFIGPRTIITAGHCVYMHKAGGWAKSITVTPGRNGNSSPFGSCTATQFFTVRGWINKRSRPYDYGAIILGKNCKFKGNPGVFKIGKPKTQHLKNYFLNISGYHADRPRSGKNGRNQWWHGKKAVRITNSLIYHRMDTGGGASGSPYWWKFKNGGRKVVGIHTTGGSYANSGVRINQTVYKNLMSWKKVGDRK